MLSGPAARPRGGAGLAAGTTATRVTEGPTIAERSWSSVPGRGQTSASHQRGRTYEVKVTATGPGQPLGYGYRPAVRRFVTTGEPLKQGEVRERGGIHVKAGRPRSGAVCHVVHEGGSSTRCVAASEHANSRWPRLRPVGIRLNQLTLDHVENAARTTVIMRSEGCSVGSGDEPYVVEGGGDEADRTGGCPVAVIVGHGPEGPRQSRGNGAKGIEGKDGTRTIRRLRGRSGI